MRDPVKLPIQFDWVVFEQDALVKALQYKQNWRMLGVGLIDSSDEERDCTTPLATGLIIDHQRVVEHPEYVIALLSTLSERSIFSCVSDRAVQILLFKHRCIYTEQEPDYLTP